MVTTDLNLYSTLEMPLLLPMLTCAEKTVNYTM